MYEIEEDDTIHELCEKVFDTTISEILNVRSQINQDVLESAIEALANAKELRFMLLEALLRLLWMHNTNFLD
jgi:RpiR family carbohydrate utilization transcriptional regulator